MSEFLSSPFFKFLLLLLIALALIVVGGLLNEETEDAVRDSVFDTPIFVFLQPIAIVAGFLGGFLTKSRKIRRKR